MAGKILGNSVLYLLLVICTGLLCSPLLKYFILESEGSKYAFGGFTPEELNENRNSAEETEMEKDIAIPDLTEIMEHIGDADRKDVIGGIAIQAVGLYLPVFNGTTKANLMVGAGTMQPGRTMGEGNYCLAGHHLRNKSLLFGPLLKVKEGDWIQLTDKQNLYTYEVDMIEIISQENIGVMAESDNPVITLITCDKTGVNTNDRLMVRGKLLDISRADAAQEQGQEANPYIVSYSAMEAKKEGHKEYLIWIWAAGVCIFSGAVMLVMKKILSVKEA